jgi:hypothetical protein
MTGAYKTKCTEKTFRQVRERKREQGRENER